MKVLISGGNGMVGRNLINFMSKGDFKVLAPRSAELNLMDARSLKNYLAEHKPDAVVHCAGLVGGIADNIKRPFDYFYENLEIGKNIVIESHKAGISKLINLGSSCMYPKDNDGFLKEEQILTGPLEPTNEGYALAKISVAKLCSYLKEQSGVSFKTLIPCNIYGKWDKFDPQRSHMIPAVIRKLHLAKSGLAEALIWGDGSARREFMYAEDLAHFIAFALESYDALEMVTNVGLGHDHSIKEYYEEVAKVVGFSGDFTYDLSKPTGMQRKLCSIEKQEVLGWKPLHSLQLGLEKTYEFFLENYGV